MEVKSKDKYNGYGDGYRDKEEKILKRRRKKLFLRSTWGIVKLLLLLGFLGACIKGMNYFYNSNYFKVKEMVVEGNDHYEKEEILNQLGEINGENIFEIDKKMTEEKLLKNLVWLKEVRINKVFPDKVFISIIERKPFIKIECKGRFYILDSEGVVLEEIDEDDVGKYKDLLLVRDVVDYYPTPGEKIAKKNVLGCGDIYLLLEDHLKKKIRNAMVTNDVYGDIVFVTFDNKKIIFGSSENALEKCKVLEQILIQLLEEGYNYDIIDIRNFKTPAVSIK